jgi:hypothetical protein
MTDSRRRSTSARENRYPPEVPMMTHEMQVREQFVNFSDMSLRREIAARLKADAPTPVSRDVLFNILAAILREQPL